MEIIGWIGCGAFALSALPQAILSFRQKHSDGISWGLVFFWWVGEWASLIYVAPLGKLPLVANYIANIVFVSVITYYKIYRRPNAIHRNGSKKTISLRSTTKNRRRA